MSNQFPSRRHKSFLENQDTQDLNISNEDDLRKEIENNLNLINETSSEDEGNFSSLNNCNNANKDLECNKDDFKNFFKILENSNNKNRSNYNINDNDDETNSVESDCFNEFQDLHNVNFNNLNKNNGINNNYANNYSDFNANNDNINWKKRHSHPIKNSNLNNAKNNQNPNTNAVECSNTLNNNFDSSNQNNFNNNYKNFNANFAANFSEQYYNNISPINTKSQQNTNLFFPNGLQMNNMENFNLTNIPAFKNNPNNNINNNSNNSINFNNLSCKNNNSSLSNFSNIPSCNKELRRNSLYAPFSQEDSDFSTENFTCDVQANTASFNNQIPENLIAYNNLNANRRKSFNCLNNNANILGQDLFSLSPKKAFLNQQQSRKSFINPGCKNSANHFNINLISAAANNFNNAIESGEFYNVNNNNIKDASIPYNNPMLDYYANNSNNGSMEQIFNGSFNPCFYSMSVNNAANNGFCMNNFMTNNMLNNSNNNANYHPQGGINYYKMQAQTASKIPVSAACLYNNPNINQNNVNNINKVLKNNITNSTPNANNINCPNTNSKFISSAKAQTPTQNSKSVPQGSSNSTNPLNVKHSNSAAATAAFSHLNLFNTKKANKANNNAPIQAVPGVAQPDPNSIDDKHLIENITNFLKDQNGCRLLQKKIEEKKYDLIMSFYESVIKSPNFIEVVNDQFGNYVIQKFIEVIYKDKLIMTTFFENIEPKIFEVSVNLYGTRVFQKALDLLEKNYNFIENDKINKVFKRLVLENMMELIVDTNGNHVFMKVIGIYPKEENEFIFEELFKRSKEIAMLKQGGTVFQKAFEHGTKNQKDKLVFEILCYIKELINDEYGNFIIQQIVFMKNMEYNKTIVDFICENVLMLSQQKFSSNVIDKCILLEDEGNSNYIRVNIINSIINKKIVGDLLIDQYGNYVVQKSLLKSEEDNFNTLIKEIKNNLGLILSKPFGRKIYDNLVKNYSEYLGSLTSKQILNSQEDKYKQINQSIKKSKKNENEKKQKV